MDKLHELQAERGLAADKLKLLVEGPKEKFDAAKVTELKGEIDDLSQRIAAIEMSRGIQASLSTLVPGQANPSMPSEPAHKFVRYGKLSKAFEDKDGPARAYKVGQFVRSVLFDKADATQWCKDNGILLQRAQGEGVNSLGGVLVPDEMSAAIIALRETYGIFRKETRVWPMKEDTLNVPRRTGGVTMYFVGEGGTITDSSVGFDNVNLTAKKGAVLTKLSTELAEDAVINIGDFVVEEIAWAFAKGEDGCGFIGDGTSTYGGMRGLTNLAVDGNHNAGKSVAASGHITYGQVDATDITSMMALLPQYALPNAKFYISQTGFAATFERLIATLGGNRMDIIDGSIVYRYLGFPIVISQQLPLVTSTLANKAMMFFGDLKLAAAMGERRGLTIMRLNELFRANDQIGIMGTERFHINVHDMGDNTTAGPLVSLVAPAS